MATFDQLAKAGQVEDMEGAVAPSVTPDQSALTQSAYEAMVARAHDIGYNKGFREAEKRYKVPVFSVEETLKKLGK